MKEVTHTIIPLKDNKSSSQIVLEIEREVEKYWKSGWVFVNAEPDALVENLCITLEREICV